MMKQISKASEMTAHKIELDQVDWDAFNTSKAKGSIKKDRAFFEYKLKRENVFLVQVDGFYMLIKAHTHLYVGEVGNIEEAQVKSLLRSVNKLARKLGCGKVIFTLSKNHWLYDLLCREITPEESLPIGFYMIDRHIDPGDIQFSNADYDTF